MAGKPGIHNSDESGAEVRAPSREKMLEWIATLSAAGLGYRLLRRGNEWVLCFSPEETAAARAEIKAYEEANANWPPSSDAKPAEHDKASNTWAPAWGALFLAWFYVWLGPCDSASPATLAGAANAAGIVSGEWWRVVTALTIHTNLVHLAGNAITLLLFANAACGMLGGGLGWLLILAAGATGNAVTAFVASPLHVSVGASTACFGALGVISSYQSLRFLRRSGEWRSMLGRTWIPVWAGVALLGMTGTAPGTDLAAHAFGFIAGMLLAVPFGWRGATGLPDWAQRAIEMFCITVVMLCWQAAFRSIP